MSNYKVIGGNQREYGPVSADEVRQWIGDGRLNAQSLVQPGDGGEWKPLGTFAEFADALHQPAAPPQISPVPGGPTDWAEKVLAREPELRLGECLASGLSFFTANVGFVIGAVSITSLLKSILGFIPVINVLLTGVLTGGLYLACLRRMRGEPASVASIFDGFKFCFVQLMLVGAISGLLAELSTLLCVLPWVYLTVAWTFAVPLVADKRLEFWSAMELSRKVSTRVWFQLFLLLLLIFLPFIGAQALAGIKIGGYAFAVMRDADFDVSQIIPTIGTHIPPILKLIFTWGLVGKVVFLVCQFFAVGALMRAYENLFGTRES